MKSLRRPWWIPFMLVAGVCACAAGSTLHISGSLSRPGKSAPPPVAVSQAVAVVDFSEVGPPTGEIGRDFDHVRPIVWEGRPGKTVADLIAAVLSEKGIRVVRAASQGEAPPDVAAKVWGRVDEFRVNARRSGVFQVENAGRVAVTVEAAGGTAPGGWSSSISSDVWNMDVFVTPEGVGEALAAAANTVAEETVRRLVAAGVISLPPPPEPPAGAAKEEK